MTAATIAIRYLGQCGAVITVTERPPIARYGSDVYTAECAGCLNTYADDYKGFPAPFRTSLAKAREWASQHSTTCRALPQPADKEN